MNPTYSKREQEYKSICCGKGCNNVGIYRLRIIYVKKTGLFCSKCKKELENCGLVSVSESKGL